MRSGGYVVDAIEVVAMNSLAKGGEAGCKSGLIKWRNGGNLFRKRSRKSETKNKSGDKKAVIKVHFKF